MLIDRCCFVSVEEFLCDGCPTLLVSPLLVLIFALLLLLCENIFTDAPTRSRWRGNNTLKGTEVLKGIARKSFGKEVGKLLLGVDVENFNLMLVIFLPNEVVFSFNMFRPLVKLGILY